MLLSFFSQNLFSSVLLSTLKIEKLDAFFGENQRNGREFFDGGGGEKKKEKHHRFFFFVFFLFFFYENKECYHCEKDDDDEEFLVHLCRRETKRWMHVSKRDDDDSDDDESKSLSQKKTKDFNINQPENMQKRSLGINVCASLAAGSRECALVLLPILEELYTNSKIILHISLTIILTFFFFFFLILLLTISLLNSC